MMKELNVEESNEDNNLLNKLNELKQIIQSDITNDNSSISDCIIEGLFSKVIVEKNIFIFKLNCGKSSNEEVLITKLQKMMLRNMKANIINIKNYD